MRFTIKAKLAGGFASVLILAGIAGAVGYQRLTAAEEAMKFVVSRSEVQTHVLDAKANGIRGISNTRAAVISADDAQMADFSKRAADNGPTPSPPWRRRRPTSPPRRAAALRGFVRQVRQAAGAGHQGGGAHPDQLEWRAWAEINANGRPAAAALRAELDGFVNGGRARRAATNSCAPRRPSRSAWEGLGPDAVGDGATSLEALEQRVTATKQMRDEVSRTMDDLLRVGAAHGLPVEAIRQKYNAWAASFQKALATVETGASVRAADLASGEYAVASTTAIRAFDALIEFQNKRMTEAVTRARAESSEGQTMLLARWRGAAAPRPRHRHLARRHDLPGPEPRGVARGCGVDRRSQPDGDRDLPRRDRATSSPP